MWVTGDRLPLTRLCPKPHNTVLNSVPRHYEDSADMRFSRVAQTAIWDAAKLSTVDERWRRREKEREGERWADWICSFKLLAFLIETLIPTSELLNVTGVSVGAGVQVECAAAAAADSSAGVGVWCVALRAPPPPPPPPLSSPCRCWNAPTASVLEQPWQR